MKAVLCVVALLVMLLGSCAVVANSQPHGEDEYYIHQEDANGGNRYKVEAVDDIRYAEGGEEATGVECKLCGVVVNNVLQELGTRHQQCLAKNEEAKKEGTQETKDCSLDPVNDESYEYLQHLCGDLILDWFPAIEEQDGANDGDVMDLLEKEHDADKHDPSVMGGVEKEQEMEVTPEGGAEDPDLDKWPEDMPPVPEEHKAQIQDICKQLFFSEHSSQLDVVQVAGQALLQHGGDSTVSRPAFAFAAKRVCGDTCQIPATKEWPAEFGPMKIKGFSMSMKRLK